MVQGAFHRLHDAVFDPEYLRDALGVNHFAGRAWIIDQIDQYIATHAQGYVVVQAEAGMGKTALATYLAFTRNCTFHFTRLEGARSPEQARRSIAAQLIGQWQLHHLAPGDAFPSVADRPDWLLKVIREAVNRRDQLGLAEPLVLVVDGLDEAEPPIAGRDTGIPLGLPRPEHLPGGAFIIATSRFGTPLAPLRGPVQWCTIVADDVRNLADMRSYLHGVVFGEFDPTLRDQLNSNDVDKQQFIDQLIDRCGGVWIYLRYVLDEIRDQRRGPYELDRVPDDVFNFYFEQANARATITAPIGARQTSMEKAGQSVERTRVNPFSVPGAERDPARPLNPWEYPEQVAYYADVGGAGAMFEAFTERWRALDTVLASGGLVVAVGPEGCGKTSLLNRCIAWLANSLLNSGVRPVIIDLTGSVWSHDSIVDRLVGSSRRLADHLTALHLLPPGESDRLAAASSNPSELYKLIGRVLPRNLALILSMPPVGDLVGEIEEYSALAGRGVLIFAETAYFRPALERWPDISARSARAGIQPILLRVGPVGTSDGYAFIKSRLEARSSEGVFPSMDDDTIRRFVDSSGTKTIRFLNKLLYSVYEERLQEGSRAGKVTYEDIVEYFFGRVVPEPDIVERGGR